MIGARAVVSLGLAALAVIAIGWLALRLVPNEAWRPALKPVAWQSVHGWREDDQRPALAAFAASCDALRPGRLTPGAGATDWTEVCGIARALVASGVDRARVRRFFETRFQAYRVRVGWRGRGLVTGYFEPRLRGSRVRRPRFAVPIYRRPDDLVRVDLGAFRAELAGVRIAGRVENGVLRPYPGRADIDAGALAGRGLELAWLADPVDAFFLQIQGSGLIELVGGGTLRVGYAGHNGHPYKAIGRVLVRDGALSSDEVSMQTIAAWLRRHRDRAAAVMAENPSYIFFREVPGAGPVGTLGVALTPARSLAVDGRWWPLGAPVWLDTRVPKGARKTRAFRHLMVAQDTGGAIAGPLRGDIFFGTGAAAGASAGRMNSRARFYLLWPRRNAGGQ